MSDGTWGCRSGCQTPRLQTVRCDESSHRRLQEGPASSTAKTVGNVSSLVIMEGVFLFRCEATQANHESDE